MSAGNAAIITAAFASQNYETLRGCFSDGLHQPYREKLVPHLRETINAAEKAGALGAFLSGSGSAICAVALNHADKIAKAMRAALRPKNARTVITRADNRGACIVRS
jgi:homoserine kinase